MATESSFRQWEVWNYGFTAFHLWVAQDINKG